MITYESKQHKGVFVTSDGIVDPKYKTMTIQFADGKIQSLSVATIKKWWVVVDNVQVEEPVAEEPTETIESEPIVEQTVEKPIPKKVKQNKKVGCPDNFMALVAEIAEKYGVEIRMWPKKPRMFAVRNLKGREALEIYRGNNSFKVRVRVECVPAGMEYTPHKHVSYGATIDLPYTKTGYKTLETLIKKSIAYTPTKKTKDSKKEEM